MTTDAWEKTGRDAAEEDIAGGAEPCTTLDEARRRIGQWLRSQTPGVAAVDAETCAAAYLAAWQAHARDTAPLDLDAIVAKWRRVGTLDVVRDEDGNLALDDGEYGIIARMDCDDPGFVEAAGVLAGAARDVNDLAAEVRRLTADNARLRAAVREYVDAADAHALAVAAETPELYRDWRKQLRAAADRSSAGFDALRALVAEVSK